MTRRAREKICTEKVCVDFLVPKTFEKVPKMIGELFAARFLDV